MAYQKSRFYDMSILKTWMTPKEVMAIGRTGSSNLYIQKTTFSYRAETLDKIQDKKS